MFYIGIDIAKRSHQAAVTDAAGNIIVKPFNFKNSASGFAQFLSVLEANSVSKDSCIIGLESTGHYWYPLYFFLVEQKFSVKVFNPIQTAAFREITIRKVKNDTLTSSCIAGVSSSNPYPSSSPSYNSSNVYPFGTYSSTSFFLFLFTFSSEKLLPMHCTSSFGNISDNSY